MEFVLTVWLAYLLLRFVRFVLQEDVYPRMDLAPGLSYAASSLLNYIILALGFVAALGVLGVDFSKVSLLAGAFSVGIGFGLQRSSIILSPALSCCSSGRYTSAIPSRSASFWARSRDRYPS